MKDSIGLVGLWVCLWGISLIRLIEVKRYAHGGWNYSLGCSWTCTRQGKLAFCSLIVNMI